MRGTYSITIQTIAVIIVVLFASCRGDNSKNDQTRLSENGIAVANKAINSYQLLNKSVRNQQYDNEIVQILTDHSPATYSMQTDMGKLQIIDDIIKKQAALTLFRKAYASYNLFLDRNFDFGSSNLKDRLYTACAALDSFEVSEFYTERVQNLKQQISQGHFKENMAVFELSKLYADLWDNDSQNWFMLLENELRNYKDGINKVPYTSFEVSKIKKLVDKPYNDEAILVNLYKLKLVKEKELTTGFLMEELQKVSDSFELLTELNGELLKKKPDQAKINNLNNKLEAITDVGQVK
ncbi:MAG: hypothetical protein B6I20_09950 [Bacteroidetes bacterium 4572_117]|nr:MAG: hypothetical protein B6I20_09950 [Bacteroidetes bacterium 4572_117]